MFELMPLTRAMMSPFYDIDKMTRSVFGESPVRAFRTDIQDDGDHYTLEAELPGFRKEDIAIDIDMGDGEEEATVWTCDFSYEYVKINGEYHT